jgi:hypothetical protein
MSGLVSDLAGNYRLKISGMKTVRNARKKPDSYVMMS